MSSKEKIGGTSITTRGMKWYKFLIYFWLFAEAVSFGLTGIMLCIENLDGLIVTFFTSLLSDTSNLIPNMMDAFYGLTTSPTNAFYGLACIVLAIWTLLVRSSLVWRKRSGPKSLRLLYIWSAVAAVLYIVLPWTYTLLLLGVDNFAAIFSMFDLLFCIISVVRNVALIIINHIYFGRRKEMFTY